MPQDDALTPQYAIPFSIKGGVVQVVEQDDEEDILQNAVIVLRYSTGEREALPMFGIPDQALRQNGADLEVISRAVRVWEPDVEIEDIVSIIENSTDNYVTIELSAQQREDDRG